MARILTTGRTCSVLARLAVLAAGVGLSVPLGGEAAAQEPQRAILQLIVNQVDKGEIVVRLRPGDVLVRVSDLEQAGLGPLAGLRETIDGETHVSLASLRPGLAFEVDEAALALRLTAPPALLATTVIDLEPGRPPGIVYSRDTSGFVNYAVSLFDLERYAAFGEAGLSVGSHLLFSGVSRTPEAGLVRGLTSYTLDDRERLTRWVVGDSVASSGPLGSSLVVGGLGVSREFGLDPYFVRYPTVGLSGATLTPSTAEVYVNGALVRREALPPGPFELQNLPVPAGSGVTRVLIRDPFGRVTEVAAPFYFTTALLARGLHEFTYNLGFPRLNVGTSSSDYGSLGFLGHHRLGVTEGLTAALRLELSTEVASGGPTATLRLPVGEMEVAAAASRDGDRQGLAGSLAYAYVSRPVSLGGSLRMLSDRYATLNLRAADDRARREATAFVGFQIGPRVSLTLQYTEAELRDRGRQERASVFASVRLTDRLNLFLSGSHARETASSPGEEGETITARRAVNEAFVGLTYFFGHSTTGSLAYQRRGSESTETVELQRVLPVGTGFGYRVQGSTSSDRDLAAGTVQYQGPYGRYEASGEYADGRGGSTLSVSGGLIAIGGAVYPTRAVQEGFALIRVPGVEGVRGSANNQEIGRTNARGDLPVPNLLGYYGNRLAIQDEDIPLDYRVDAVEKTVAPPFRGGAVVAFPVQRIQVLTGSLRIERGGRATTPVHGQLTVTAGGTPFGSPLGRRGEFYLEDLPAGRHPAVVEHAETTCAFTLEVPASAAPVLDLGTVSCVVPEGGGGVP